MRASGRTSFLVVMPLLGVLSWAMPAVAGFDLGAEHLVLADGSEIIVPGYSVPSFAPWDGDALPDLIVGEGGGTASQGKVRIYLNVGPAGDPQFTDYFYAQSNGIDLSVPASGCMGAFPRTVYWDGDDRKDLVVGLADGTVKLFSNTATDQSPAFDGGTLLQVGSPGFKVPIDVGYRATPCVVDWNNDGRKDLVVGALDGKIHIYINEGTDTVPDFLAQTFAQENGFDLVVSTGRSSPVACDLDHDGKKDLLSGNTAGQLLLYSNEGTDAAPLFSGFIPVEADGAPIDLAGDLRSRPFVCDWNEDGLLDGLLGAGDGKVRLYPGIYGETSVAASGAGPALSLDIRPRPLLAQCTISFELREPGLVRLTVHDTGGRRLALLVEGSRGAGFNRVEWDGHGDSGRPLPAGIYFVRLEIPAAAYTSKLVLVR